MSNARLSITLSNPTSSTEGGGLFLEQDSFDPYVGEMTKLGFFKNVLFLVNPDVFIASYCGGSDGKFKTDIYAYPDDPNLNYAIATTHGYLLDPVQETVQKESLVTPSLQLQVSLQYPCSGVVEAKWEGDVYDRYGNVLASPPGFTVLGKTITFESEVYGGLRLVYEIIRFKHSLQMFSKNTDGGNYTIKYQSTVYANWNGGVDWVDVEAPEDFENTDGACGNGSFSVTPAGGDGNPPTVDPVDDNIDIDYCTQEVL